MTVIDEVKKIKKQSLQARYIADALRKFGQVNVTDAWNGQYGGAKIRRLGARIHELRVADYVIRTQEKENGECFYFLISEPGAQLPLL